MIPNYFRIVLLIFISVRFGMFFFLLVIIDKRIPMKEEWTQNGNYGFLIVFYWNIKLSILLNLTNSRISYTEFTRFFFRECALNTTRVLHGNLVSVLLASTFVYFHRILNRTDKGSQSKNITPVLPAKSLILFHF